MNMEHIESALLATFARNNLIETLTFALYLELLIRTPDPQEKLADLRRRTVDSMRSAEMPAGTSMESADLALDIQTKTIAATENFWNELAKQVGQAEDATTADPRE